MNTPSKFGLTLVAVAVAALVGCGKEEPKKAEAPKAAAPTEAPKAAAPTTAPAAPAAPKATEAPKTASTRGAGTRGRGGDPAPLHQRGCSRR